MARPEPPTTGNWVKGNFYLELPDEGISQLQSNPAKVPTTPERELKLLERLEKILEESHPWHFWRKSFGRREALVYLKEVWTIPRERFLAADRNADELNKPKRLPWLINGREPCFMKSDLDVWAKVECERGLEPVKGLEVIRNA